MNAGQPGEPPSGAARTARRILVEGRVQGVGFRWFVREEARARRVAGWVRNLPDGRVEALLEGEPGAVAELVERVRRGKRGSRVEDLAAEDTPPAGLVDFEIR